MNNKETVEKNPTPQLGSVGEAGGQMMPSIAGGLLYNPETIPLRTYIQMEDDAQIKAVLTLIKAPLVKAVWSINCDDDDIARFCKENLEPQWGKLIRNLTNALNFGFQAFEKVWKKQGSSWVYDDFMDLYPPSVHIKVKEGHFDGIYQYTTKGSADISQEKCFVFTNEKRFGNLYGRSKLRSAYMYWFIDKYTYDFENVYFERYATPLLKGEAPTGRTQTSTSSQASEDNIDILLNKLKVARGLGAIVIPSDVDPVTKAPRWKVEFLEATRRGADFRSRHEYLDLMKARAIFAPELVFSAPYAGSSYALAREHAMIFMSAEEALLEEIKAHINSYILPQLVLYNFGSKAPKATWDYESIAPEVKTLLRDLVMTMVAGDIVRPDPDWIASTLGIKLREEATKTQERDIRSKMQDVMMKQLEKQGQEATAEAGAAEPGEAEAQQRSDAIRRILEAMKGAAPQETIPEETPVAETAMPPEKKPGLSKSAAAFKRWATTPTSKRFRSPRAWEKAYSKGLFEEVFVDLQNSIMFRFRKKYSFDDTKDAYVQPKEEMLQQLKEQFMSCMQEQLANDQSQQKAKKFCSLQLMKQIQSSGMLDKLIQNKLVVPQVAGVPAQPETPAEKPTLQQFKEKIFRWLKKKGESHA